MAGPGRPPKPTRLKIITGDAGKRTKAKAKPRGRAAKSKPPTVAEKQDAIVQSIDRTPPDYLNEDGCEEWHRVIALLVDQRKYHNHFRSQVGAYCEAYQRWRWALRQIAPEKAGEYIRAVVETPNGYPQQSAELQILNKALEQMRLLGNEFGLSVLAAIRAQAAQLDLFDGLEAPAPDSGGDQPTGTDGWGGF